LEIRRTTRPAFRKTRKQTRKSESSPVRSPVECPGPNPHPSAIGPSKNRRHRSNVEKRKEDQTSSKRIAGQRVRRTTRTAALEVKRNSSFESDCRRVLLPPNPLADFSARHPDNPPAMWKALTADACIKNTRKLTEEAIQVGGPTVLPEVSSRRGSHAPGRDLVLPDLPER